MPTGSIVKADGWRRYETKTLVITILNSGGINLSAHPMRFLVCRQQGDVPIVTKTTAIGGGLTVTGGTGTNTAQVTFNPDDYDDLPPSNYAGMLIDDFDDSVLWPKADESGDLYIGQGWRV